MTRKKKRKPTFTERVALGLRVSPHIKDQLDWAAERSGRSQSTEAAYRLERSFAREDLLEEALTLRFGESAAGLILTTALVMEMAGQTHLLLSEKVLGLREKNELPEDFWTTFGTGAWADDPDAREIGMLAAIAALALLPKRKKGEEIQAKQLGRALIPAIQYMKILRAGELDANVARKRSGLLWLEITMLIRLLDPEMLTRPPETVVDDVVQAFRGVAKILEPAIDSVTEVSKS